MPPTSFPGHLVFASWKVVLPGAWTRNISVSFGSGKAIPWGSWGEVLCGPRILSLRFLPFLRTVWTRKAFPKAKCQSCRHPPWHCNVLFESLPGSCTVMCPSCRSNQRLDPDHRRQVALPQLDQSRRFSSIRLDQIQHWKTTRRRRIRLVNMMVKTRHWNFRVYSLRIPWHLLSGLEIQMQDIAGFM